MDHGTQYLSDHFLQQIRYWGIRPSFGFVEEPETNGVVERENRTLKEQAIYGRVFGRSTTCALPSPRLPSDTTRAGADRRRPISRAGRHILEQVSGAFMEAHDAGLIHRDIEPANIILCERGGMPDVAKVVDFGLVKPVAAGDSDATTMVTTTKPVLDPPMGTTNPPPSGSSFTTICMVKPPAGTFEKLHSPAEFVVVVCTVPSAAVS